MSEQYNTQRLLDTAAMESLPKWLRDEIRGAVDEVERLRAALAAERKKNSALITGQMIIDLAEFAGFTVVSKDDETMLECEFVVTDCPDSGVFDDDKDSTPKHYGLAAYYSEYPEEGMIGLGPEIPPPNNQTEG